MINWEKQLMRNLYISWQEGYNLGIPIIDEQHRAIVSTINTFYYFVNSGKAEQALQPTFVTLNEYTKTHFLTEEIILKEADYPELIIHLKLHSELSKKMIEIAKKSIQEKNYDVVLNFLRKWW
ncbi:MAG TPA: hypothetical protein EYP90_07725, partial [Chromatiaceae bacterium]|nr:hypothetical protein [Chromatiaceae bacterium]